MTYLPIKRGMTEAVTRGELEAAGRLGSNWRVERIEGSKRLVEEGMTIAGDGAAELGKLMREQHKKGGPVPHA